jgi:hypothetical protein
MFSPDPKKAQEPVMLIPGNVFTLHLKPNNITNPDNSNVRGLNDTKSTDLNSTRTVLLAKAVRWRSSDEVKVEFNRDMATTAKPTKYFADNRGEFTVSPEIKRVSFSSGQGQGVVKLYLEIE